jgi:hypothetical protein
MDSGDFKSIAELARTIGRDRTYVSKVLSILTLPQAVIDDLIKKKSTNDRTVLDQLRSIKDEKKCAEIYFWYIQSKGDRFGLKQKIKEALEVEEGVEKMYEIKETYKGLTVKLPKLNKKQLDKLEHFFEELLQNK